MGKIKVKIFKSHPTVRGAVIGTHNAKVGDEVTMYGRGHPKGIIVKVDRSLYHGGKGSIWYDVRRKNGKVETMRDWDFMEVWRTKK